MIKSVTVTNHVGESLKLELRSPEKSGLLIQSIEGLGPSKATINSVDIATVDGSMYNSSRITSRNIVITLAMLFSPTIEDARQKTYRFFPINKRIQLRIETDNRDVMIFGWVESNEPNIFSSLETTQISIICPDPYFYASKGQSSAFSGAEPMFEFPFSNESPTEKMIQFGEIRIDSRAIINYTGDVDTGMTMTLHALGSVEKITLYNSRTRESMFIDTDKIQKITGGPYGTLDDIIITTTPGKKTAQLLRNGIYYNVIGAIGRDADWFKLTQGDNIFDYTAEKGGDDLMIIFSYQNAYGGI